VVVTFNGAPVTVIGFTIADGKIVEIDAISDPQRLATIAAALLAND
jgi:RNA polymerase sigma-70 factor (ECF subfamily)